MKTNRRNFLGLLGIGSVSAPLAAKTAADQEIASLTSLAGYARPALSGGGGISSEGPPQGNDSCLKMSDYLKVFGKLPVHIERDVRERSKYIAFLDPDIACKRSWSLNVKIAAQQQRNYDKEIERYRQMGWYETTQRSFERDMGFRWTW